MVPESRTASNASHEVDDSPVLRFRQQLRHLVPRPNATYVLIAVNLAVFAAFLARGGGLWISSAEQMLSSGANFGPNTLGGDWWRLASSMTLHAGLIHLVLNTVSLVALGPTVERLLGSLVFLVLYVAAGVAGGLATLFWDPWRVSVGASAGVFGLFGALLAIVTMRAARPPWALVEPIFFRTGAFLVLLVAYGSIFRGIDVAGQVGGLVMGLALGAAGARNVWQSSAANGMRRLRVVSALGVLLSVVPVATLSRAPARIVDATEYLFTTEPTIIRAYQRIARAYDEHRLDKARFERRMRSEVLEPWSAIAQRLQAVSTERDVPDHIQQRIETLLRYANLRGEVWDLLLRGAVEDSSELLGRAEVDQREANRLVQVYREQ